MRPTTLLIGCLLISSTVAAKIDLDSAYYDSLQLSNDIKINNSRAYKTYHSTNTWFKSGYNNPSSNAIGRSGIVSTSDYISNTSAPSYSYRNLGNSLVLVNGVPYNTYDILTSSSNEPVRFVDYISPLEVQNISLVKGNKLSNIYGAYGSNGSVFINSNSLTKDGLNFSFNSGYSNLKDRPSSTPTFRNAFITLREGIRTDYRNKNFSTNLIAEYLHADWDQSINYKTNGYYLSSNTTFQLNDNLKINAYFNKYHNNRKAEGDPGDLTNGRLTGSVNIHYAPLNFLSFDVGGSLLSIGQKLERPANTYIDKNETKWNQKFYYAKVSSEKRISELFGVTTNIGLRKMSKKKTLEVSQGVLTNDLELENDLDYLHGDVSFDFKRTLYLGYSINNEKNSLFAGNNNEINYKTIYSSFIFSELLNKNRILSNGLLRMNYSHIGDNIRMYELGSEISFLNDKLNTSFTYFKNKEEFNNGSVVTSGVEIEAFARPKRFWNITFNWAKFDSEVTGINTGTPIGLGGIINSLNNGIDPIFSGLTVVGDSNPDWNTSLYNDFTFNKLSFGFLTTYRRGGDIFSLSSFDGSGSLTSTVLDSSGLIIRNIYFTYSFVDFMKLDNLEIGISAQNIFAKTNLPGDEIPQDAVSIGSTNADVKSINLNLKIDF